MSESTRSGAGAASDAAPPSAEARQALELLEKHLQTVASLQVFEKNSDGYPRPDENGRPSQNVGVAMHNLILPERCHSWK